MEITWLNFPILKKTLTNLTFKIVSATTPIPLYQWQAFLFALNLFSVRNVRYCQITPQNPILDEVSLWTEMVFAEFSHE